MELSSLFKQYNVPLSKSERQLISGLNSTSTSRSDEYYDQQIKRLADARETLKSLPDKKTSDRQSKAEKAKALKERLKMLKQMIPFMSAAAAKSLKAELKQIAAQISALKDGGGSGDPFSAGTTATAETQVAATDESASGEASTATVAAEGVESTQQTEAASATSDEASVATVAKEEDNSKQQDTSVTDSSTTTTRSDADKEQAAKTKAENDQDRALKDSIEELKRLLKTVQSMLQRKLQQSDDKGGQQSDLSLQLQAYLVLPENGTALNVKG